MTNPTLTQTAVKGLSLLNPADWGFSWTGDTQRTITVAQAYRDVGWFRAAVDTRVNSVVSTPWEITRGEEVVWTGEEDPPKGLEAFKDMHVILAQTAMSKVIAGSAWFLKVSTTGRGIDAVQYMAPDTIEPVVTKQGLLSWARYVDSTLVDKFKPEQVIYVSTPNPFQELPVKKDERMSEGKAALIHADILYEIDNFTRGGLKRGLIRPVLVMVPPGTGDKEKNRIKAWFSEKFGGAKKSGNFGVAEAGALDVHEFGESLGEFGAVDLTELHRQGLCAALRVPYSMLLTLGAANRSVSEQAIRDYIERVITPELRQIETAFNEQAIVALGYRMRFHPERLEMFQAAELDKADKVATLFESGLVTRNEAREPIEGLDPIEGPEGDEFFVAPAPIALSTNGQSRSAKVHRLRPFSTA